MSRQDISQTLNVPMKSLADLAVEWWRLSSGLKETSGAVRHALRKIEDFLRQCELEVQSLDGRPFDAGLAATVLDTVEDPVLEPGRAVIEQTVCPLVLWRGTVLRAAEVVTRRGA